MRSVLFACLAVLVAVPAVAQDPVKVAPDHYKVLAENERVRVLHATLPPGGKAAMHSHPVHIGVGLNDSTVHMEFPDGKTSDVPLKKDEAIISPAGAHITANTTASPVDVIVVELKGPAGTATLPADRPGMKRTRILQDPRAEVYRVSIDSSFKEAPGTTHDYDQVVIQLGASDLSLTMEGKTTSAWKRGDVRLVGRGVPHEAKGGSKPADMIIVAIK